jgi:hypothetical protein
MACCFLSYASIGVQVLVYELVFKCNVFVVCNLLREHFMALVISDFKNAIKLILFLLDVRISH